MEGIFRNFIEKMNSKWLLIKSNDKLLFQCYLEGKTVASQTFTIYRYGAVFERRPEWNHSKSLKKWLKKENTFCVLALSYKNQFFSVQNGRNEERAQYALPNFKRGKSKKLQIFRNHYCISLSIATDFCTSSLQNR